MSRVQWREFLSDYWGGLSNLPELVRRISFKKRTLEDELHEASLRGTLRRSFGGWELLLFGIGVVIGPNVYSGNGTTGWYAVGPALFLSYAIAGFSALCAAAIYGEFVMEYPISGGGFTYTMLTFGELPAWMTLTALILSYVVGMAGVAKGFAANLTRLTNYSQSFVINPDSSNPIDPFAFGLVLLCTLVLSLGSKEYAFMVSGSSLLKVSVMLTVIIATFTHADSSNMSPFTGPPLLVPPNNRTELGYPPYEECNPQNPAGPPAGAQGVFAAVAITYYGYVGFDALSNTAEEAKDPAELPFSLVGTVLTSFVLYVFTALSFALFASVGEVPFSSNGRPQPSLVFGCENMAWLQYLVAVVGILGCLGGLLVGLFSLARLVMVAARDWLLPPLLAEVYPRTQTPVVAQVTVGVIVAILGLIVPLDDLAALVTFGFLFAMWMVCNAQMYRRYFPDAKLRYTNYGTVEAAASKRKYMEWTLGHRLPLHMQKAMVWAHLLLLVVVDIGLAMYWQLSGGSGGTAGFLGGWALVTFSLQMLCPLEYQPAAKWAIAWWLMPWLPSFSNLLIVFSLGSLDWSKQWWRITVWAGASLVWYLLFSLPMSYIKRRKLDHVNAEELNVVELTQESDGRWVCQSGMAPSASDSSALPHSAQLGLVGMMNSITKPSAYGSMLRPSALQPRQSLAHAPSATPPETQGASPFWAVTDSAASTGGVGVALGVLPPLPPGAARTGSVGLPPASPMGARTQSDALQSLQSVQSIQSMQSIASIPSSSLAVAVAAATAALRQPRSRRGGVQLGPGAASPPGRGPHVGSPPGPQVGSFTSQASSMLSQHSQNVSSMSSQYSLGLPSPRPPHRSPQQGGGGGEQGSGTGTGAR